MPRRGGSSNPEFVSYVVGTNAVFVEITVPLRREMLRGFLQQLQYLESHRARERLQNPQSSFLHFVTSQSYEILSERQSFAIVHYVLGDLKQVIAVPIASTSVALLNGGLSAAL